MVNLTVLKRVWERINITTSQSGVMDAKDALELIDMAKRTEEAEKTIDSIENIMSEFTPLKINVKSIMAIGSVLSVYRMKKG